MINCACCNNTRKITYEGEETPCPVCEDYLGGEQDGVGKAKKQHDDVQSNPARDTDAVGKEAKGHHRPRS